tara:strand:+ start:168 stop:350 length:183 start_codon:yes stop_codon:yes gene_type:complete
MIYSMKPKPILKQNTETGVWYATYTSEFGQEFKSLGHTPGQAVEAWHKKYGKKFGLEGRG